MKFYHGSRVANMNTLQPYISNHGESWVYLTSRRENTLVYLSNAIEKFHKDNGIKYDGPFYKWASYGFNKEGILVVEEYYPNATEDTYKGIDGFIYCADNVEDYTEQDDIPFSVVTDKPVKVTSMEYILDAYEEILKLEKSGKIIIRRYEDNSDEKLEWIKEAIINEFNNHQDKADYIIFLKGKFQFLTDRRTFKL